MTKSIIKSMTTNQLAIEMTQKNLKKCMINLSNAEERNASREKIVNIQRKVGYCSYILGILQKMEIEK